MPRATAILVVVAIGACNFDDSFTIDVRVDPGRPGAEFRQACTEQAAASCAYEARCNAFLFEQEWPSAATCIERITLTCQLRALEPHANHDDDSIRACALPGDFPCRADPSFEPALQGFRERCPETRGDLPNASPCSSSAGCESGLCWREYPAQPCGICRQDPCAACGETDRCQGNASPDFCVSRGDPGRACFGADDCKSGHCKDLACAPPPQEGDPCQEHCGSVPEWGLFCNPSTLKCERLEMLTAGQSCVGGYTNDWVCAFGSDCFQHQGTKTCVSPVADGATCFPPQGLGCLEPAQCLDGFCRFPSPLVCSPD